MNKILYIIIAALFIILLVSITNRKFEGFHSMNNKYNHVLRHRHMLRHRYNHLPYHYGNYTNYFTYPMHYLNFNWWGPHRFYNWIVPCNCKKGCTPEGCSYPGNGPDDCVWATDCNCCGF